MVGKIVAIERSIAMEKYENLETGQNKEVILVGE